MPDNPSPFLLAARQIPGDVGNRQQRNIESIAKPNKPRGLVGSIDIEASGHLFRLIGDNADGPSVQARETDNDVLGVDR